MAKKETKQEKQIRIAAQEKKATKRRQKRVGIALIVVSVILIITMVGTSIRF